MYLESDEKETLVSVNWCSTRRVLRDQLALSAHQSNSVELLLAVEFETS